VAVKSAPKQAAPEHDEKKPRYWLRRLVALTLIACAGFVVLFGVFYVFAAIPQPQDVASARSSVVEDAKGRFVGRLHSGEDRAIVPLAQIPKIARSAVIAAEDRNFYRHKGISPLGVFRAALSNLVAGKIKQGGSTITQQYVKNAFVGNRRTMTRKFKEAVVSVKLERKWSKDQILEAYLNTIYFGRGAYGIDAAARAYYGVPASRLTLPQAALIAAVIRAPERLDPVKQPEAALRNRNRVLKAMRAEGMITKEEQDAAVKTKLAALPRATGVSGRGPYFLEAVRRDGVASFQWMVSGTSSWIAPLKLASPNWTSLTLNSVPLNWQEAVRLPPVPAKEKLPSGPVAIDPIPDTVTVMLRKGTVCMPWHSSHLPV